MERLNSIGARLKAERERLDLSQEAMAALGGVKKRAQQNYEKGNRAPDAIYLSGIEKAGVDILYILMGTRIGDPKLVPEEAALLDNYRNSSEEGKQAIQATSALLAQQRATQKGKVA